MMTDERLAEIKIMIAGHNYDLVEECLDEIDRLRAELDATQHTLDDEESAHQETLAERDKLREKLRWLIGVAEEWVPFEKHYGPWAEAKALVEGK
jgi:hypothetical protein